MPASPTSVRPRSFYPALDGLRAVAFLAVFAVHYGTVVSGAAALRWGWAGVDVFFVLSGFLITGILFDSLDEPRYFRNFYIRRTLRIFPLFYGFWLLMLLLTPLLGVDWNRYNLALIAYLGNFFRAGAWMHRHPDPGLLQLKHLLPKGGVAQVGADPLWSLCVEEQFYLVWPAIVWLIRSRTRLLALCIAVFLAEPLLRELYWRLSPLSAQHGAIYFSTFTRIDTLLAGAALALWMRGPARRTRTFNAVSCTLLFAPLPVLAMLTKLFSAPNTKGIPINWVEDHVVNVVGFSLIALFSTGVLIFAVQPKSWLYRLLHVRPLLAIGRRTYGLYLVHALPLYLAIVHVLPRLQARSLGFLFIPLALGYTFATAWLSFRYLETPFLALKDRYAPKTPEREPPPSPLLQSQVNSAD